jgi:hypothetical protein
MGVRIKNFTVPIVVPLWVDEIMVLVDEYADAFHGAVRPDGSLQCADGYVAKVKKDAIRAALADIPRTMGEQK